MNPVVEGIDSGALRKDAIFLSPHKMIGGVETPGILIVKKRLLKWVIFIKRVVNLVVGSVFFVSKIEQQFLISF